MRRALALPLLLALLPAGAAVSLAQRGAQTGEWTNHGGDQGSTKYAPLDQITAANVKSLEVVWRRPGVDPAV